VPDEGDDDEGLNEFDNASVCSDESSMSTAVTNELTTDSHKTSTPQQETKEKSTTHLHISSNRKTTLQKTQKERAGYGCGTNVKIKGDTWD